MAPDEDQGRIAGLDAAAPTKDDPLEEGPAHLRELKRVLKGSFAGFAGAVLAQGTVVRDDPAGAGVYPVWVAEWDVALFTAGSLLLFRADEANGLNPRVWLNRERLMRWVDGAGSALPAGRVASGEWTLSVADGEALRLLSPADVGRVTADFERGLARVEAQAREREAALTRQVEGFGTAVDEAVALAGRVTANESALESHRSDLDAAQAGVEKNQADLEAAQAEIEKAQAGLDAVDVEGIKAAVLDDLKGRFRTRIETVEATAQAAEDKAQAVSAEASALSGRVTANETALDAHGSALEAAQAGVKKNRTDIDANRATLETHQSDLEQAQAAIARNAAALEAGGGEGDEGLRAAVREARAQAESAVATAQTAEDKAQTASAEASALADRVTANESALEKTRTDIDTAQSAIPKNRTDIDANRATLETHGSEIGQAQAKADSSVTATQQLRTYVAEQRGELNASLEKTRTDLDAAQAVIEKNAGEIARNRSSIADNAAGLVEAKRWLNQLDPDARGVPRRWTRYHLLAASSVNAANFKLHVPAGVTHVGVACFGAGGKQAYGVGDAGAGGAGFAYGVFEVEPGRELPSMQVGTDENDGVTGYGEWLLAHPGGDATYRDFKSVPGEGGVGEVKGEVLGALTARGGRGGGVSRRLPTDAEGARPEQYGETLITVGGGGGGSGSFYGDGGAGGAGVSGAYVGSAGGGGGFGGSGGEGQAASGCGAGGGGVCDAFFGGGLARGGAAGRRSLASASTGAKWEDPWGLGGGGGGGSGSAGQAGRQRGWRVPFSSGGHGGSGLNGVGGAGALTLVQAAGRGASDGDCFLDLAHRCLGGGGGGGANVYHACGGDGGPGGGGGGACVTLSTHAYARAGMGGLGGGGGGAGVCPVYVWSRLSPATKPSTLSVPSQGLCGGDSLFGGGGGGGGYGGQGGRCLLGGGGLGGLRLLDEWDDAAGLWNRRSPGCIIVYWFEA